MKKTFSQIKEDTVLDVAQKMALAAQTAPRAKGIDLIETIIINGDDIKKLSNQTEAIGKRENHLGFQRDAENILSADAILLIGTKILQIGLKYCGLCGFKNCDENRSHNGVCVFNPGDMGIAVGSAVSVAADHRLDNRIMYSIGMAAKENGWFSPEVKIAYGIPLSAGPKNPFFDRK
jgi:uncharacterized ferredoxin-like protein